MFVVTTAALDRLSTEIGQAPSDTQEDACFRLVSRNGAGLALELQRPEATDETFEHDGVVVLALPKLLAEAVGDGILDLDSDGILILRQ